MTVRIRKRIGSILQALCSLFLLMLLAAELFLYLKPGGCSIYAVTSGSMAPAIPVGSCILVKAAPAAEIRAGQIISFALSQSELTVTHRVVEHDSLQKMFWTQGDANRTPDPSPVPYENVIGTVRLIIPLAGYLLVFLSGIRGKLAAASLLLLLLLPPVFPEKAGGRRERADGREQTEIRTSERRRHV